MDEANINSNVLALSQYVRAMELSALSLENPFVLESVDILGISAKAVDHYVHFQLPKLEAVLGIVR